MRTYQDPDNTIQRAPLTYLSRMEFPPLINYSGPFSVLMVVWVLFFIYFFSNFDRTFCKRTVVTLIRRRDLQGRIQTLPLWGGGGAPIFFEGSRGPPRPLWVQGKVLVGGEAPGSKTIFSILNGFGELSFIMFLAYFSSLEY